eukprot:GILJ01003416.1.p1 GENE.GILJ01003416.1~~GILJ01003416.1.p1  ORF type:complete len:197 (-),score=22.56 GILJ01003416.1:194-784(-)
MEDFPNAEVHQNLISLEEEIDEDLSSHVQEQKKHQHSTVMASNLHPAIRKSENSDLLSKPDDVLLKCDFPNGSPSRPRALSSLAMPPGLSVKPVNVICRYCFRASLTRVEIARIASSSKKATDPFGTTATSASQMVLSSVAEFCCNMWSSIFFCCLTVPVAKHYCRFCEKELFCARLPKNAVIVKLHTNQPAPSAL